MGKRKNEVVSMTTDNGLSLTDILTSSRKGIFEEGHDKLGRPYQKKLDDNGIYTKEERLKDGTPKLTIKKMKKRNKVLANTLSICVFLFYLNLEKLFMNFSDNILSTENQQVIINNVIEVKIGVYLYKI